ncbi:unnamed protein product [Lathyrus sativus]|nr:unnamed protein product [Lathyrus sativus]
MTLISSFFSCFGISSNSLSQVFDYDKKLSQSKSSSSEKSKSKEIIKGAPLVVYHFPVNSNLSLL